MILLDRYIEAAALRTFLLVAAGLTALFSLLEFVDQLRDVGQGHYRTIDALFYVLLTAPSRLLQLAPVSMLVGSLFALGAFASNSELTAMRAIGISERRIIWWILKLAGPILIALFLIAEFVIPPAQQLAQSERTSKISSSAAPLRSNNGYWAEGGHQYLNVRHFDHGNIPRNIDIYAFSAGGLLKDFIHADRAAIMPDGTWLLTDVLRKRFDTPQIETDHLASLSWNSFLHPQQVHLLILPPESMPPVELYKYVRDLRRQHQEAARYEQELWAKIDIPLSMAAMILIAIPFVFGPLRTQSAGQRIAVGAIIGIVFTLVQQIASHLSLLFNIDTAFAATAPTLLLLALALYLLRRSHL